MSAEKENLVETYKKVKEEFGINLYDKVLDLRKFEIENFWKRTLFFWGTIAMIYVGFFNSKLNEYQIVLPLIGLLFNLIFSLSTRGSKYWQEHWETIAIVYENELNFSFFNYNTQSIINKSSKSKLTKPYRFSVSKLTMLLSDLSVLLWVFLWIKELVILIDESKLNFEFCLSTSEIHWYTVGIILIHIILIGYFMVFMWKGNVQHRFKKQRTEK